MLMTEFNLTDYVDAFQKEAWQDGKQEGRQEGKIEMLLELVREGSISEEKFKEKTGMTVEEAENMVE